MGITTDLRTVWRKLIGDGVQYGPTTTLWQIDTEIDTNQNPVVGPYVNQESTPNSETPTVFEDVINIKGRGELTYYSIKKRVTQRAVQPEIRVTVDGTIIGGGVDPDAGMAMVGGDTKDEKFALLVAWSESRSGDPGTRGGITGVLCFTKSLRLEFRWTENPGDGEACQHNYWYWFT